MMCNPSLRCLRVVPACRSLVSCFLLAASLFAASLFALSPGCLLAQEENFQKLQPKIAKLIEQLGDDSFSSREQAQLELKRIGVVAFDALRMAQNHDDVEIARRARYLVRSIQVRWPRRGDSPQVIRVLENYGSNSEAARSRLLDRLTALIDGEGVPALSRIARFDASAKLAKRAALLIAEMPQPESQQERTARADVILKELGVSKRESTDWLRAFAATLRDPEKSLSEWKRITELAVMRRDRLPDETNDLQVKRLLQLYADVLIQVGQRDQAEAQARRLLKLVRSRRDTLLDQIDWLMERELYAVIDELIAMYPHRVDRFLSLRYRLAESLLRQGKTQAAEKAALAALESQPEAFESHIEAALELQERSLMDWCLREFDAVIERADSASLHQVRARLMLSEIHHDYERDLLAGQTLEPVVKLIDENNEEIIERIGQPPLNRTAAGVKSRMHLFHALHARAKKDFPKQLEHLRKGVEADSSDADLLIALHHAQGADAEFKKFAAGHIDAYLKTSLDQIRELKAYEAKAPNESSRNDIRNAIAGVNNQFAWLASNTERDLETATRCSHLSLEIRPNTAAYLDTLAHCYAAQGKYKEAVKYQSKAANLEPFSFQIVKKLKVFQAKLQP